MFIKIVLMLASLVLVGGCELSNDRSDRQQRVRESLILEDLLGYWSPVSTEGDEYEFFLAETETYNVTRSELKTGRIFRDGSQTHWFYWELNDNGVISITVTDLLCESRPLTTCATLRREIITPTGKRSGVNNWEIEKDFDLTGVYDLKLNIEYSRKTLSLDTIPAHESYFSFNDTFSAAWRIESEGDEITVVLPGWLENLEPQSDDLVLSASRSNRDTFYLQFSGGVETSVEYMEEFLVLDTGYQEFPVRMWLDKVYLYASAKNSYSINYELHQEVVIPDHIDKSLVQLEGVEKKTSFSHRLSVVSEPSISPNIVPGDRFFSNIRVDFNKDYAADGIANEIIFTSETEGVVNRNDVIRGTYNETKKFEWSYESPEKIVLHFDGYGTVYLSFIQEIEGGFQVLYDLPYETIPSRRRYYLHDFLKDEGAIDMRNYLPGKFLVNSATGTGYFEVSFFDDGTLETSFDGVTGFWFIGEDGFVYSYQCETFSRFIVPDYEECLDMFADLKTIDSNAKYVHVRRMKFVDFDGEVFKSSYSAAAWGDAFEIFDDQYIGFNWTYRWIRIGDAIAEK